MRYALWAIYVVSLASLIDTSVEGTKYARFGWHVSALNKHQLTALLKVLKNPPDLFVGVDCRIFSRIMQLPSFRVPRSFWRNCPF